MRTPFGVVEAGDARIHRVAPAQLAPPAGHCAHATVANGWVFVSGQLPIAADGRPMRDAPFAVQALRALSNVEATLRAAGSSPQHIVQVRVYVDDIGHWPAFNRLYAAWVGEPSPARCVEPIPELHDGLKIEVECTALVADSDAAAPAPALVKPLA
jgi:enamine deaminase RidA (YjgF/YER057c/UK114 family)